MVQLQSGTKTSQCASCCRWRSPKSVGRGSWPMIRVNISCIFNMFANDNSNNQRFSYLIIMVRQQESPSYLSDLQLQIQPNDHHPPRPSLTAAATPMKPVQCTAEGGPRHSHPAKLLEASQSLRKPQHCAAAVCDIATTTMAGSKQVQNHRIAGINQYGLSNYEVSCWVEKSTIKNGAIKTSE